MLGSLSPWSGVRRWKGKQTQSNSRESVPHMRPQQDNSYWLCSYSRVSRERVEAHCALTLPFHRRWLRKVHIRCPHFAQMLARRSWGQGARWLLDQDPGRSARPPVTDSGYSWSRVSYYPNILICFPWLTTSNNDIFLAIANGPWENTSNLY